MDKIKVYSPGSIGNVGCGFDVFGLAIDTIGDIVEVSRNNSGKLTISAIIGDDTLSRDPARNIVTVGAQAVLKAQQNTDGYDFTITKGVSAGSGLGSSGCSATAGVFAINELLGNPYDKDALLEFAAIGEQLASPKVHYDNIGPSLFGGLCLVRSVDPLEILKLDVPDELYLAMAKPGVVIKTNDAKKILDDNIPLETAIKQFGNISGLITGFQRGDIPLIGRSVEDFIATPKRSKLIPKFDDARSLALAAKASGFNISGSGPAMFAICEGRTIAEQVIDQLKNLYADDSKAEFYIVKADMQGTRVLS